MERVVAEWGDLVRLKKKGPDVGLCLVEEGRWGEIGGPEEPYCQRYRGAGTWHAGAGRCSRHGGNSQQGSLEGLLQMVHAFARFEQVTPWEALLREVSRTNGAVEWLQEKIGQAAEDDDLLPDGAYGGYVKMWNEQRKHGLAVYNATMSIGVERILAEQNRIDGERMAQVLVAGMDAAGMTPEQREVASAAMRAALEAHSARERVRGELEGSGTGEGA